MKLLAQNYKLDKNVPGMRITGLSLAPHTVGGFKTVCPHSTPECRANCLGTETGQNVFKTALNAKIERTRMFFEERNSFKEQLHAEINLANRAANRVGEQLAVRLNVYSDIVWELEFPELFFDFPEVQFYDYTKIPHRFELPLNYHLTYSYSGTEKSKDAAAEYIGNGNSVAVVFPVTKKDAPLPARWEGIRVVDGDLNDYRPADPSPCIVGLRFKGGADRLLTIKKFVQPATVEV